MTTEKLFIPLVSNVKTLKGRGLQNKDSEISIAVLLSDLEKGVKEPKLYASRYGMIYDPESEFKPNIANNHKLPEQHIEDFYKMKDEARQYLKKIQPFFIKDETKKEDSPEMKKEDSRELEEMKKMLIEQQAHIKAQQDKIRELAELAKKDDGKIRHEKFETIVGLLNRKQAVYLHGDSGTGKSRIAEDVAETLKLDFYPASTITQEFKLTGFEDGNGKYHETNFYKAVKNGGLFFLDEMDSCASDVMVGLNGVLASGYFDFPNETIYIHKDFKVLAAGNTIGHGATEKFTGRQALDMATLDRFWAVAIDYSLAIDKEVAHNDMDLVEFARSLRQASKETEINIIMSYRSISRIADFQDMFSLAEIMDMAVIKGIAEDDIKMLARNMSIDSKNKYFKAFKDAI